MSYNNSINEQAHILSIVIDKNFKLSPHYS